MDVRRDRHQPDPGKAGGIHDLGIDRFFNFVEEVGRKEKPDGHRAGVLRLHVVEALTRILDGRFPAHGALNRSINDLRLRSLKLARYRGGHRRITIVGFCRLSRCEDLSRPALLKPLPEKATDWRRLAALSLIVRSPVRAPSWLGVKVTMKTQL